MHAPFEVQSSSKNVSDFPSLTWVIQEAYKVVLGNVPTLAFLSNSVHVPVIEAGL